MTRFVQQLASDMPSLAIKTGFSQKRELGTKLASTLEVAVDTAMSGTPMLFLDARDRPSLELSEHITNRAGMIEAAKKVSTQSKHMDAQQHRNHIPYACASIHTGLSEGERGARASWSRGDARRVRPCILSRGACRRWRPDDGGADLRQTRSRQLVSLTGTFRAPNHSAITAPPLQRH